MVKNPSANVGDVGLILGMVRSPGEGNGTFLPTPVFLLEIFHGQRSLVGYSPQGRKELDMTQRLNSNNLSLHKINTC